ncbi:MAG: hypothetical protein JJLCMIEE_00288 [Acidimicrobiales bacterium]|nr:hypothetical protein [Acidimicrobiales bacterium]
MMAATLDAFRGQIIPSCPLDRISQPTAVAGVFAHLVSRAGSRGTGTVIPVDGGISTTR